jgi:hypothetical protein
MKSGSSRLCSARNPLLWIVTYEKTRFESYLFEAGPSWAWATAGCALALTMTRA